MVNKLTKNELFRAWVALGSNLKIPIDELKSVPHLLVEHSPADTIQIESISYYYRTPAFPKGSGPDYINAAFEITTTLPPEDLLAQLHHIESEYDRERPYRWASRTLDLDLLFYENEIRPNPEIWQKWADLPVEKAQEIAPEELILPHPRAHERYFVLGPLLDIAPDLRHPALGKSIQELWDSLDAQDRLTIKRI